MTMRTIYRVICNCGHKGGIRLSENDQPFSSNWEKYSLIDLNGGSFATTDPGLSWERIFKEIKPTCPKCQSKLGIQNLIDK